MADAGRGKGYQPHEVGSCQSASSRFREVLLDLRGTWWIDYATRVSIGDAGVDDQRMHIGDHTQHGEALQGLDIQMVLQSILNRQLWDAVLQTQRSSS